MVYDDIEPFLPESVKINMNKKLYNYYLLYGKYGRARDDTRPFDPWEVNLQCLKSCKYKHIKPKPKQKEKRWLLSGGGVKQQNLLEFSL